MFLWRFAIFVIFSLLRYYRVLLVKTKLILRLDFYRCIFRSIEYAKMLNFECFVIFEIQIEKNLHLNIVSMKLLQFGVSFHSTLEAWSNINFRDKSCFRGVTETVRCIFLRILQAQKVFTTYLSGWILE